MWLIIAMNVRNHLQRETNTNALQNVNFVLPTEKVKNVRVEK